MEIENRTTFYTKGFNTHICECSGIIYLNEGDRFLNKKGDVYAVVFKMFNPVLMIMIYHGKLITSNND